MKIEKTSIPNGIMKDAVSQQSAKGKPALPSAAGQQPSSGISVSLGSTAAQLRSIENSMSGSAIVDAAKVAEIKQAISEGRFKVNPDVVAGRLLATVQDLIDNNA